MPWRTPSIKSEKQKSQFTVPTADFTQKMICCSSRWTVITKFTENTMHTVCVERLLKVSIFSIFYYFEAQKWLCNSFGKRRCLFNSQFTSGADSLNHVHRAGRRQGHIRVVREIHQYIFNYLVQTPNHCTNEPSGEWCAAYAYCV